VDIADATALKNWVETSAQKFGRIDLVVACGMSDTFYLICLTLTVL
jgi:NADP-dependent 3-hydroxy acid dehydrogenase YdfG